MIDISSVYFVW